MGRSWCRNNNKKKYQVIYTRWVGGAGARGCSWSTNCNKPASLIQTSKTSRQTARHTITVLSQSSRRRRRRPTIGGGLNPPPSPGPNGRSKRQAYRNKKSRNTLRNTNKYIQNRHRRRRNGQKYIQNRRRSDQQYIQNLRRRRRKV